MWGCPPAWQRYYIELLAAQTRGEYIQLIAHVRFPMLALFASAFSAIAGPGLGVRVLGDVTAGDALEVLRNVRPIAHMHCLRRSSSPFKDPSVDSVDACNRS